MLDLIVPKHLMHCLVKAMGEELGHRLAGLTAPSIVYMA
jgi:hypothetical protein